IYAKLANGMARYNCARASPTRNSSVLRSLARRQQAQYPQVTHRQGSGRMTGNPEIILLVCRSVDVKWGCLRLAGSSALGNALWKLRGLLIQIRPARQRPFYAGWKGELEKWRITRRNQPS